MSSRPTRAALLGVLALALALLGVPAFLPPASDPSFQGVVLDGRGFGIADMPLFLFSEEPPSLVEETRSDARGGFAFHLDASHPRVLVRPPGASAWLPQWGPPTADPARPLAFVLEPARSLEVQVRDLGGHPVRGAEVRVYEQRLDPALLATALTDENGSAHLVAGSRVHLAAFTPGAVRLARWRFDLAVPREGGEALLTLPPAERLRGHVLGPDGPLAGILLLTREEGLEGGWNGFGASDGAGAFEVCTSPGPTELLALDPAGIHLPTRTRLHPSTDSGFELRLERGVPQGVSTSLEGRPLRARVWSWSPGAGVWGWGQDTDREGRVQLPVEARFALHAAPLEPSIAALEAWDVPREEGVLRLEARGPH